MAAVPEATAWLNEEALHPFLEEVRAERLAEVDRIAEHVELSLTEVLQRIDEEIGRAAEEVENNVTGAEGRLAQAEARHAEVLARRDRRRDELNRQKGLTLQGVERLASLLILPHPEVAEFFHFKADDYERWLRGMRRLQDKLVRRRTA